MWSVVYADSDGTVIQIGPKPSEDAALEAAKKAMADGDFDIQDQRVYLLHPNHRMVELCEEDFFVPNTKGFPRWEALCVGLNWPDRGVS